MKFGERLTIVFIYLTFGLFVSSLIAHASLYTGFNFQTHFPTLWFVLQAGVVIGFIPVGVGYLSEHFADEPPREPKPYVPGSAAYIGPPHLAELLVGVAMAIVLFYPFFNFHYWETTLNGYPEMIDGKYFMHYYHGGGVRSISPEEFAVKSLAEARKLSGHWMAFHMMALLLLLEQAKPAPGSFLHRFKSRFS